MQCYQPLFFRRRKSKVARREGPADPHRNPILFNSCRLAAAAFIDSSISELTVEPLRGVGDDDDDHDRLRSRSPPPHHLPPPPPPPPPPNGNDLRHFVGGHHANFHRSSLAHAHLHQSVGPNGARETSLNRSSSPVHDLGYHTLVARSPAPWSPNDLADLSLTPSPRSTPSPFAPQRGPRKSPRPQPPPTPSSKVEPVTTEALIAACKGKKWQTQQTTLLSSTKCSPFERLTDDLLLRILSYLPSTQLALCGRVCRRWHVLAWEPQLWSTIVLTGDNLPVDRALKSITRVLGRASPPFCPSVERVLLNGCPRLTDRGLQTLSRRCPELRNIELRGCAQLTDVGVLELVSKCVHLSHLDVSGCSQITCIEAGPRGNGSGGNGSSSSCSERYGTDLNSSCSSPCPRPQLFLQLQYLDLTDCVGLADAGVQMIVRSCTQLTCLYLRRCAHVTDVGIKHIASYCTALRELSISDCLQVTDFGMYELARLGPNLRYLSVAKCDQISDAGIKQIGRLCYKLRYLNLRGCEAVSDDSLEVLARSCSRLRALDLGKCDITDRGLRLLAEHCPNLKKLSVKSCELVTDEGVRSIAYYCRGLRQLNIQDCLITVEGYRAVKKFCRKCIIEHTNPGFF